MARFAIAILVSAIAACASPTPGPMRSPEIATVGGGFVSDLRKEETRYAISFELLKSYPEPTFVVAEFENPVEPHRPFRTEKLVPPGLRRVDIQSPPVHGLTVGTNYRVAFRWYSDERQTTQIGELNQLVQWIGFRGLRKPLP